MFVWFSWYLLFRYHFIDTMYLNYSFLPLKHLWVMKKLNILSNKKPQWLSKEIGWIYKNISFKWSYFCNILCSCCYSVFDYMYSSFDQLLCFSIIGMAGLAVTYGLNLNARLSRWILSFCKLENKIISIERIYQYCQIPSEAPAVIECCRPPTSWPENGTVELIDLKVCGIQ